MPKDKAVRVALYARVSTLNHGQDTGLQLDELRAVAKQRGWTVAGEYVDEGIIRFRVIPTGPWSDDAGGTFREGGRGDGLAV